MRSVADDLRRRTMAHVLDLTPAARIELALSLGDDDLDLFVRTSGLDRDEAPQTHGAAARRASAQRRRHAALVTPLRRQSSTHG